MLPTLTFSALTKLIRDYLAPKFDDFERKLDKVDIAHESLGRLTDRVEGYLFSTEIALGIVSLRTFLRQRVSLMIAVDDG